LIHHGGKEMSKNYRSELVGAFGSPIDENPTGVMEEAAFRAKGLDYRYLTIKVNQGDLEKAMDGIRAMNFRGINLTIPHKVEVMKYMDELSEAAKIIGAVNMVVNKNGRLWGDNTDGKGYLISLNNAGVSPEGKNITILGAGGAARAISVECALVGAKKITITNIVREQGEELTSLLKERTGIEAEFIMWDKPVKIPDDTHILSNATSVGLYPDIDQKPDIDYDTIYHGMVVTDVIFNDPNSLFLQEAKKRGAQTINGLGMLVNQGALNFKLWTGVDAPVELMVNTLKQEFGL
jgi:shikimate dehydrogenase